ncbi:GNAT family N-acetyltransferase [Clostridium intestinale]|uniref:GNAT family N-acetyltransferase n=1 Tax=Clostridium intestinale TaxID=36845 RepID=UPI0028ECCD95|nr:GNAT family N-acetyltransferase [Clostridium intestinale]
MIKKIVLRELKDDDVSLFKKWLYVPHVSKWYSDPSDWVDEVTKRNSDYNWINHFIVEVDKRPIGFCQYYEYYNSGEVWHGEIEITGTYSIDYMIGETDYLKKGFGKEIIKQLMEKIKAQKNAKRIIVQPEPENKASCNTLLSCGFIFDEVNKIYVIYL